MSKAELDLVNLLKTEGINKRGYGLIPKLIMQDKRLTRDAKCIYSYFCSYAGAGDTAFPSVSKICYDLNFGCEDTFRKHFKLLITYGYIKVEKNRSKKGKFENNIYTLCSFPSPILTENLGSPKKPEVLPSPNSTVMDKNGDRENPPTENNSTNNNSTNNNSSLKKEEEEEGGKNFNNEIINFENYTGLKLYGLVHRDLYIKWRKEWNFTPEMVLRAGELMALYSKNHNLKFIDETLFNWYRKEIKTLEQVEQEIQIHKKNKTVKKPFQKKEENNICATTGKEYVDISTLY